MSADRIEKKILLHAPLKRVWSALSDSAEFGAWFGMRFNQQFVPGAPEGVMLTVTESGFDQLPAARRGRAFTTNEGGWSMAVTLIEKYVRDGQ